MEGERLSFEEFCVCTKQIIRKNLPTEGLIKSPSSVCLSVCLSVRQFGVFLFIFAQIRVKRVQNGLKIGSFWILEKNLSLVFLENNLKWKLILLLIFHHQSHIS